MLACYCACVPLFRLLLEVLALHLGAHIPLGGVCEMVGTFLGGSFAFMSLHDGLECYEVCAGLWEETKNASLRIAARPTFPLQRSAAPRQKGDSHC